MAMMPSTRICARSRMMNGPVNGGNDRHAPAMRAKPDPLHSRPMSPVGFMARISTIGAYRLK